MHMHCLGSITVFFKKILKDISPFCGATDNPCFGLLVMFPPGFKARVGSLIHTWQRHTCYMFPDIYLWCNTYWPLASQNGSWLATYLWTGIVGAGNRDLFCRHSRCETNYCLKIHNAQLQVSIAHILISYNLGHLIWVIWKRIIIIKLL